MKHSLPEMEPGETGEKYAWRVISGFMLAHESHGLSLLGDPPTLDEMASLGETDTRNVYIARCSVVDGPIKIGVALDVGRRIAEMQTACPYKLLLMGTLPGGKNGERRLHKLFAHFRLQGEWFSSPQPVMKTLLDLLEEQKRRMTVSV